MRYRFWFFVHMIPRFSFPDESSAVAAIKIFTPSGSLVVRDVPRTGFHTFTNGFTRYCCARPASFPGDLSNENSKRDFCKSDDIPRSREPVHSDDTQSLTAPFETVVRPYDGDEALSIG